MTQGDGSNAWQEKGPHDVEGEWVDKSPISYNVKVYDQHYLVWYFAKPQMFIQPHKHIHPHSSIILKGTVIVTGEKEGRNNIPLTAPDVVHFDAGVEHSIRGLTEGALIMHTYPAGVDPADKE